MPHYLLAQKRGNFDMTYHHHHHHVWEKNLIFEYEKTKKFWFINNVSMQKFLHLLKTTQQMKSVWNYWMLTFCVLLNTFLFLAWYVLWNTYAKHLCTSCLIEIVDNRVLIEFRIKVIEKCNFLCTKLNSREFFHLIVFFDLRIIFFFSS